MGNLCSKASAAEKGKEIMGGRDPTVVNEIHVQSTKSAITVTVTEKVVSEKVAPVAVEPQLTREQVDQRKRITETYKYYRGEKSLAELPLLFEKFNGREAELLLDLERQYPATRRASALVGFDMYASADDANQQDEMRASDHAMDAFRGALKRDIWMYLDGENEMGPFAVEEMRERANDSRWTVEMKVKLSHWGAFHPASEVFTGGAEPFSYSPLEPGRSSSSSSSSTPTTATKQGPPIIKGMAPRPMANRKGSMIPHAPSSLPLPATPAHPPPPAPATTTSPTQFEFEQPSSTPIATPEHAPPPAPPTVPDAATDTATADPGPCPAGLP